MLVFVSTTLLSYYTASFLISYLSKRLKITGIDCHKKDKPVITEGLGVGSGLSFCVSLLLLMIIYKNTGKEYMNYYGICSTLLFTLILGFMDDLIDLEWRYKLVVPAVMMIPTLLLYNDSTYVILPLFGLIDLGSLYYIYMILVGIFSTNCINILSGINGLEVVQVMILSIFLFFDGVLSHDIFMVRCASCLFFSSLPLYFKNKYPAKVFVGDSFCYFGGMAISCVCILGHSTRTLFFLLGIQICNFVISLPQLLKIIPCPRHRMPDFDGEKLIASKWNKKNINLTLLNVILCLVGSMEEDKLCNLIGGLQFLWCVFVIFVKYSFFVKVVPLI
ncbi:UDP-N-acetylglucosamine--dolichyl-phosphate N-acetylglucosaminephosphotransferase [Hamiltosporidium tvaerminnensis]|uniref:UDP-N-acetylglucosamine--dolichyl-phosphate N-acetylglucosaminephosphotransferase n=1 Tax=Hamiltosporidium tvaerminnensis TaxID=1176355 RepID=A0A4V2JXH7_9MICR|nr:hypothetical protein LUQ84_000532 [Hamiltosporidium tvaerminnensis]TBU03467.1 UDP-N-acetylglucosamine--dolichyl-phosphate N-acetylglucosaminephosphotransferase [Hamiltosporidium tvaerminnensis]TBU11862.1 UDP-N-acetylglucosamine--dolichyl-phosphate N-acetylglucosaminephosphotransferase [Hamiltosporidium tvaerminnensis]